MRRWLGGAVVTALVLFMACANASADWQVSFDMGDSTDHTSSVRQTSDGGYILMGSIWHVSTGEWPVVELIKTDEHGAEEWTKEIDDIRAGSCVQQTGDGGYAVAGWTYRPEGQGERDICAVKTDADGNERARRSFESVGYFAIGQYIQQTSDGGYIIVGDIEYDSPSSYDMWLIKTNAQGIEQWSRTFGGADSDGGYCVQQTIDGGYIIAGTTYSYGAGSADVWLIKTDSSGIMQWDQTFGGASSDVGCSVQQTVDGGYIIGGTTRSYGTDSSSDMWLIKTDADGTEQWSKTFGGTENDSVSNVRRTADGGYVIAGTTYHGEPEGGSDIWLIKTDSLGNKAWDKTFQDRAYTIATYVQETNDRGYIISGESTDVINDVMDLRLLLIKALAPELTRIDLAVPSDQSVLSSPPAFAWTPNGGTDNRYAVDFHIPGIVSLWSTPVISKTSWSMPGTIWNAIPPGAQVYWRVRGKDVSQPLSPIIYSEEVRSFFKE